MFALRPLRQGFPVFLAIILLTGLQNSYAQTPEDLEKMGKEAQGFQFKLKFRGSPPPTADDIKFRAITELLNKYKGQVPADLQLPFRAQGPQAAEKPFLTDDQQASLKDQSTRFFREMAEKNLTVQDLQKYKEVFKNTNPMPGDNPADPRIAWRGAYEGIERTLMGGRTLLIMDVWKQTMLDYFRSHPEAVGVVYGQMDIGSWVKMNVDGLGFAADIDFSTIATDSKSNQAIHNLFGENLRRASGLGMIPIDVVHTAHGLAGAEVFIGEWGKAFAEVDMLRRGKWKLIEVIKNENGQIVDIRTTEKEGKQLFMEKGIEAELKAQQKDPANQFDPKEKYPELSIKMEPMLSLEMLRHAIHDIEHGPFEGGQKIIKMIKYTERSFFMISEAMKEVAPNDQNTYFRLSPEEARFKTLCDQVIKNKGDGRRIAVLLEEFTGQKLEHAEQARLIAESITEQCKKAMLKNAGNAYGYRIKSIAAIKEDEQRFEEADKFLKQIEEEFNKGFREGGTEIPKSMLRAHSILVDLRAGKIPPELMNSRLEELNRLMEEEYKVDKSLVERLIGDPWAPVRNYLVKKGFGPEAVQKVLLKMKNVFADNWRRYAPELAQRPALSAYEFASHVQQKLNVLNEHLAKTKAGKIMSSDLLNYVDNTLALYDAWFSGKTTAECAWNFSWTAGTIWMQGNWPFTAIPLGIFNSIQSRSPAPAAMAVAFYLFPFAGQTYMVTNLIDRLIITQIRDYTFRSHLDKLAVMAITDGQGHVVRFKVPRAFTGLTGSPDSLETDPDIPVEDPGRTLGIKSVFYNEAFLHCPDIKYFEGLVPRQSDRLGSYESKMKNLNSLFTFDQEFLGYLAAVRQFKEEKENGTLEEILEAEIGKQRTKMLDSLGLVIEDHLWKAVFNAIESTKKSEKEGVIQSLEAVIVALQDSLYLDEWNMKKIDSLSLLLKIRKQVENDPLYIQLLKDRFSKGTAYERVAIPTLEYYIKVYRQINQLRPKLFEIWHPFGVDGSKLQEDPMRLVILGGLRGAPMLTTDPEKDLQRTIQCIEAHAKRASEIRYDLAAALSRPIKDTEKEDKEHLRILGEYGFGFERLVDAGPGGRSPLFPDEANEINTRMKTLRQAYQDYLARLREGPALTLRIQVNGEQTTTETEPVSAEAELRNEQEKPVPIPADCKIEWFLYDKSSSKEAKVAEGKTVTHDAKTQGDFVYIVRLFRNRNNQTIEVAKGYWNISVHPFNFNDPSKGIKLKLPALIKQYDVFDVSADIPALLKGRMNDCSWNWDALTGDKNCGAARLQVRQSMETTGPDGKKYLQDSITVGISFKVTDPGASRASYHSFNKKVKYQHMSLNVKATDIWEGGAGTNWFRLERKPVKNAPRVPGWSGDGKAISTAEAHATVGMKDDTPFGYEEVNTLEDLQRLMEKEAKEQEYKKLQVKPISVGDFKGFGLYSDFYYSPGGWSDAGYRSAGAGASFTGYVMKGKKFFEVYWSAGAGGAFDNSDRGWMMSMVKQLANECISILTGASFTPDGRLTRSPYTGPKPDGSDFPQVVIEPKPDTIQPGSRVTVKAVIKNDKADYGPYSYTWTGQTEGNTNVAAVQLSSARPGKQSVTVTVDGTVPPGSASLEYVVAPLKLRLIKVAPAGNKIVVGMPVELRAEFVSAKPAGKKLQYLWQPHPEEKFTPFEGSNGKSIVTFNSPGRKKVWVQVLDKTTAETITLGESEQLELEVEKPGFTIVFNPAKAPVGQLVTATIKTSPEKLEDISYRWMPPGANANQVSASQDGTEITFYAKDATQVTLEVLALVKSNGDELGRTRAYFTADRYLVKTEGPKVQGPKPMIWQTGKGLVEVDKEIAVHQQVEFTAVVTPQPSGTITYNWQVTEGNASVSNPASRDARVTALETGTVNMQVTVKDANGVELGKGLASFSATISSEQISQGAKEKKAFEEKMNRARQLIKEGKLDEALTLGEELNTMNPKEAAGLMIELAEACKKAGKEAAYERDFSLAIKRMEQALRLKPGDVTAKTQLDQYRKWQKEWPAVLAKGNELESQIAAKNTQTAEKLVADLNRMQFSMPGQMANKWSQDKYNKYVQLLKRCDSAWTITRTNWTGHFKDNDFENGLKGLEAFKNEWTGSVATMREVASSIQLCKSQIAEQNRLYTDFLQTRSAMENGQPVDPKKTLASIEYTANSRFSTKDPRRQEMIDFARSMTQKQKEMAANREKAEQLKKEGQRAESLGDKEAALEKYKSSVALVPDAVLENKIKALETEVSALKEKYRKADALWKEGENLVKKKKTKSEGLEKMKESLRWWNSPDRIRRVRELEKEINGTYSKLDMNGTWKHGSSESFTFTALGEGRYDAVEKGFGNAKGTLDMMGNTGLITYSTRDGLDGQYILTVSADGNSAVGEWKDTKASGTRNFVRTSKPATAAPQVSKTDPAKKETAKEEPKKKKKTFGEFLEGVNKGLGKIDSVITGKKPAEKPTDPPPQPAPGKSDDKGVNPADASAEEKIFDNGNIGGVSNGPTQPTTFTLSKATYITRIENYHYYNGGKKPGTIAVKHSNGQVYGPWQAYGLIGQGGVQNATWVVQPKMQLPAGTYTVIDSDPSTWSQNGQSKGCGFTVVWVPKTAKPVSTTKEPAPATPPAPAPKTTPAPEPPATTVTGTLYGTVFKTREEAKPSNPYDLSGEPLPNTAVTIRYTLNGKAVSKTVNSDANGKFEFTGLPLNTVIQVSSRGITVSRSLTAGTARQYVQFGWDGEIEVK